MKRKLDEAAEKSGRSQSQEASSSSGQGKMRGNITRRGRSSWRIKFDTGYAEDGRRTYFFETIRGTKADAVALLTKRLAERDEGLLIQQSNMTVLAHARHWLENIAPATASARTRDVTPS